MKINNEKTQILLSLPFEAKKTRYFRLLVAVAGVAFTLENVLYHCGGFFDGSQSVCKKFNAETWAWENASTMPETRRFFSTVALDQGRRLFVGGTVPKLTVTPPYIFFTVMYVRTWRNILKGDREGTTNL